MLNAKKSGIVFIGDDKSNSVENFYGRLGAGKKTFFKSIFPPKQFFTRFLLKTILLLFAVNGFNHDIGDVLGKIILPDQHFYDIFLIIIFCHGERSYMTVGVKDADRFFCVGGTVANGEGELCYSSG